MARHGKPPHNAHRDVLPHATGMGGKVADALRSIGISSIAQLQGISDTQLVAQLALRPATAARLVAWGRGDDEAVVVEQGPSKSMQVGHRTPSCGAVRASGTSSPPCRVCHLAFLPVPAGHHPESHTKLSSFPVQGALWHTLQKGERTLVLPTWMCWRAEPRFVSRTGLSLATSLLLHCRSHPLCNNLNRSRV